MKDFHLGCCRVGGRTRWDRFSVRSVRCYSNVRRAPALKISFLSPDGGGVSWIYVCHQSLNRKSVNSRSEILIRAEVLADFASISDLTVEAFEPSEFGHNGEAQIVQQLREQNDAIMSLVAVVEAELLGHVMFSKCHIDTGALAFEGAALAPMSVAPKRQRAGIGSRLVVDGLSRLSAQEVAFVVVLGHPDYYPKFGFTAASEFGIQHGFEGIPQEVLFAKQLGSQQIPSGNLVFSPVFGRQTFH